MASLFQRFGKLSFKIDHGDEEWEYTEEPHTSRRQEILKKHPEIKKLMGYDPMTAVFVSAEVFLQLFMCWMIKDASWLTVSIAAYVIGGILNHSLGSAIHEIGHNLAFGHKRPYWNRILGLWCNLPLAIPFSVTYKKYHSDHHRYLGHENMDVDIPTVIESYLFRHPLTKVFWLTIHPLIHAVRPFLKSPKPVTVWEITNFISQMTFDAIIYYVFGWKPLMYLLMGTLMSMGFHPLAGHFISEHYLFNKGQATHSYYGTGNFFLYNVGYHVEHHDFPYIPFRKLPEIRRIAPEFYNHLPYHTSWFKVLWDFIMDPGMGPHAHGVGYIPDESDPKLNGKCSTDGCSASDHAMECNGNVPHLDLERNGKKRQ